MARPKMHINDKLRAELIGLNISELLKKNNITKKQFSEKLKIPYSTALDYLNGKTLMPLFIIQRCATLLNVKNSDIDSVYRDNINAKKIFAKNFKWYLQLSGKTQKDVAKDLGFTTSSLSEWVNGNMYPRIDKIEMIADYFNISISDLIDDNSSTLYDEYIFKYEHLDPISQEAVKTLIDIEYKRLND